MKPVVFLQLINLSLLALAGIMGAWKYRKTDAAIQPMLFFVWALFLLKTAQFVCLNMGMTGGLTYELMHPVLLLLIIWQVRKWKVYEIRPFFYWAFAAGIIMIFLAEQMSTGNATNPVSLFDLVISLIITLLGIESLTRAMIHSREWPFHNPVILFSIAWILYFSFTGLLGIFLLIGKDYSPAFYDKIAYVDLAIGFLTNCIYLYAALCIPSKTNFSTPS